MPTAYVRLTDVEREEISRGALLHFLWVKSALSTDEYKLKLVPRYFSQLNMGHVSSQMPKMSVTKDH